MRFIQILAIIGVILWWRHSHSVDTGTRHRSSAPKPVIVYDLHRCGISTRLMGELDAARIPYQVRDLGNPLWKNAIAGRTSLSPPVVDVGGTIIERATLREIKAAR